MLRCLTELDVAGVRRLWFEIAPKFNHQLDDRQALVALHMARTQTERLALGHRAYSHRWLLDNGYPSQLPDELKPKAERIYPRQVEAVGISVNFRSPILKPAATVIQKAMSDAVEDAFANGDRDPPLVRRRMFDARERVMMRLFGRLK